MSIFIFRRKGYKIPIDPKRLHTLHFGLNAYQRSPLKLCVNDVKAIIPLYEQWGVLPRNMVAMYDGDCDTQNMKKALQDLVKRANPYDYVAIQYSGHASNLPCLDEIDGKMEILCPIDIHKDFEKYNVSDDFICEILTQLSQKYVTTALIPMDCCHTGGMTRTLSGIITPPSHARYLPAPAEAVYRDTRHYRSVRETFKESNRAFMIGGCEGHQVSYEYAKAGHGALTWAMLEAWKKGASMTPRKLHQSVYKQVTTVFPEQHPVLEGNETLFDLPFFTPLT
jgi:hypothetical protein